MQPIELPVFNTVALELLRLLSDHDVDMDDVIDVIKKDPALSLQILKMANSSAYSARQKSATIKESVHRLGSRQITSLAMAASQKAIHSSNLPVVDDFLKALWQHSHACATGSKSIVTSCERKELAEQAYMAGLLHDIGKLYLLKAMERINQEAPELCCLDRETILYVFSDMHVEQGCRIMDYWEIPDCYWNVVARHHDESIAPDNPLLAAVRLANFNSIKYGLNDCPQFLQPENTDQELEILKADDAMIATMESDMRGTLL